MHSAPPAVRWVNYVTEIILLMGRSELHGLFVPKIKSLDPATAYISCLIAL